MRKLFQFLCFLGIFWNTRMSVTGLFFPFNIGDDAELKWTLNPIPAKGTVVSVIHIKNESILLVAKGKVPIVTSPYADRVEFTGNTETGNINFTLKNVSMNDAGLYSTKYLDKTYPGVTLVIYVRPSIPSITGQVPVVGTNLLLECSSQSNSVPTDNKLIMWYTWFKDRASLPKDGKYVAKGKTLTIKNIQKSDNGVNITCQAKETSTLLSDISQPLIIDPEYKPDSVRFLPLNTSYRPQVGTQLGPVTCKADCKPVCTFQWIRGATNVSANATLNLSNIQREKNGNYKCLATNKHGSKASTNVINVVVEFGPENISLTPMTTSYRPVQGTRLGPITCSAECEPACSYQWSKGGRISPASNTLDIPMIQRDQEGTYTCTAYSKYGTKSVNVTVIVEFEPLKIVLNPNATQYEPIKGNRLGPVNCIADCKPACNYKWTHDGNTISAASGVLDIISIEPKQTGSYTCTATNNHGVRTINVTVTVKFSPVISLLDSKPDGPNIDENKTVHFVCETEGYPIPTVIIYFQRDATVFKQEKTLLSTLTLEKIDCLLTGYFFCNAINEVGNATMKSSLNVLCSPRLDYRKHIEVLHGIGNNENLNITGSFIANPPPTFTWKFRKNDSQIETVLKNGTESFYYINQQDDYISYGSRAIRAVTGENHFGQYILEANNTKGSTALVQTVFPRREPDPPVLHDAVCLSSREASITWISGFNGGDTQHFVLGHKSLTSTSYEKSVTYSDPGKGEKKTETLSELHADTLYFFKVYAGNKFGNSSSSENLNCTTFKILEESNPRNTAALTGGVVGGSMLALIIIAVVAIVTYKRKQQNKKGDDHELVHKHGTLEDDDPDDGMKPNIIYESAGSNFEQEKANSNDKNLCVEVNKNKIESASKGQPTDVYAEVKRPKKREDSTANVYAEVTKKGQKAEKDKKQAETKAAKKGMVYENAKSNLANGTEDVYENASQIEKEANGKLSRRKNKDGLVYIDVVIKDTGKMQKGVIHGIENRNNYAEVDFTKHADPLPFDDEDNEESVSPSNKN